MGRGTLKRAMPLLIRAMSEEQLSALLTKLREDAWLREKLAGAVGLDAAVALAKEAGFDVSKTDWVRYEAGDLDTVWIGGRKDSDGNVEEDIDVINGNCSSFAISEEDLEERWLAAGHEYLPQLFLACARTYDDGLPPPSLEIFTAYDRSSLFRDLNTSNTRRHVYRM